MLVSSNRYSDEDLALFKIQVEKKLEKANRDLSFVQTQIEELAEVMESESDKLGDSANTSDFEMLNIMANRNRKHIIDLENALLRIKNKSYGICVISGELIDKRRLMAVPTTTKSLLAKNNEALEIQEKKKPQVITTDRALKMPAEKKIITKIIRKQNTSVKIESHIKDEDELFDDDTDFSDIDLGFDDDADE